MRSASLACLFSLVALIIASCSSPTSESAFRHWLAADPARAAGFARFEGMLRHEGVSGVVPNRELWLVDRNHPRCARAWYAIPPEANWPRIVPALRFIRDYVEPAVGEVRVVSAYRDAAFNACVGGASQSAHLGFYALDLVPRDWFVTRGRLIEALCPIHAREGPKAHIGLGIYNSRRFHIDGRRFRGWGADFRGTSFPCGAD
jgi:hypothetical protein